MPPKVMNGARAKLSIIDPNTNTVQVVGIFNSVSLALQYSTQPVFILGRYSTAEIDYTGMEPVSVTASGWRVVGSGAHAAAKVPKLQDLLQHEYLQLQIIDRQTGQTVAKVTNVRPTGYSTTIDARNLEQLTVTFVGILLDDESQPQMAEAAGSTNLP